MNRVWSSMCCSQHSLQIKLLTAASALCVELTAGLDPGSSMGK